MADETAQGPADTGSAEASGAAGGGSSINSQVMDAIASLNTLSSDMGPSTSAAMLSAMGANSIGLAMLNAVARQQADSTLASAALAAVCARLSGTRLPDGAAAPGADPFIAGAEAQAHTAIALLKSQAEQDGGEPARAALERIAAAAAPPRAAAGKAGKSGGAA
jgi:hypothetical protein